MHLGHTSLKIPILLAALLFGTAAAPQGAAPASNAPLPAAPAPAVSSGNTAASKKSIEIGLRAAQAGEWAAAYDAYAEAVTLDPRNAEARLHRDEAGFRLARQHVDAAERYAVTDQLAAAEEELRAALQLGPGDPVVRERLAQIQAMATLSPQEQKRGPQLAGPARVQPQPGMHSFSYRGDIREAYQEIARQFGLTAEFDAALVAKTVRFVLPDANFSAAMTALSVASGTFWVSLNNRTFFVAEDTPQKRTAFLQEVTKTIVLSQGATSGDMDEVVRALHEVAAINKVTLSPGTREITMRDTAEKIAVGESLLKDIDVAPGELVLEIELLEVDRNNATQLGLSLPTSLTANSINQTDIRGLQQATSSQQLLSIIQSIFGSTSGGGALGGLLPPLIAFGGGLTTFYTTLPSAQANFSKTLTALRSADRLLLRSQDGQPATFFLGVRYPVSLALLSASLGTSTQTASIGAGAANNTASAISLPRTDLTAGTSPSAVVTTSLRNNNTLDIIDANQGDNTISVFLGNGDGTFAAQSVIPVGKGPVALVAADFNHDGNMDLAVVNHTDATVLILLGNGDGTFAAGQTIAVGQGAVAIATADFNSDGFLDLAVANQTSNTISILLGKGDGTFTAGVPVQTASTPHALVAADFNADGHIDLAVVNQGANSVSIFLGNGDGTFGTTTTYATGTLPSGIAEADFNNDGHLDLAISNQTDNTVSILLGNGDGTFVAQTTFATDTGPAAILTGDFNGDGIPDLITANQTANDVSVLIGVGNGTFTNVLNAPTGNAPVSLATGDFNGDTLLDLAVADQSGNTVTVLLNSLAAINSLTGSLSSTPYPSADFEDIGLKVKVTPRIHPDNQVTLQLSFDISSLAGTSVNGIPIIGNRLIEQTARLRENETTVLSGIIDREESRAISGFAGLGQVTPLNATSNFTNSSVDTELIIAITPHLLRLPPRNGHSIYAGRGDAPH